MLTFAEQTSTLEPCNTDMTNRSGFTTSRPEIGAAFCNCTSCSSLFLENLVPTPVAEQSKVDQAYSQQSVVYVRCNGR
jgi:hypothetical protein